MAESIERTYNVPLRKEFEKAPSYKRAKKAISALRKFLSRHMKSEDIIIGNDVNLKIWKHGIKNPPHHIKVTASKNDEGKVTVHLEDFKEEKDSKPKEDKKKDEKKVTEDKKEEKKETKKTKEAKEKTPVAEKKEAKQPAKSTEKKSETKPAKKASKQE